MGTEQALTTKRPAPFPPGVLFGAAGDLRWGLLFALLFAAAWSTALAGPFQFDDYNVIVDNPAVHGLQAWWQAPLGIRPLLKLSYAFNWQLAPTAFSFHVVNLLLHAVNTLLLWRLLRRLLPTEPAAIATLLWALHPAQTEAVTYICGRSVSLMTTFWLLALLDFSAGRRRLALWTLLALAVRETACVIPFSLLVLGALQGEPPGVSAKKALPAFGVVSLAAVYFLCDPAYRHLLDFSTGIRDSATQLRTQINALHYFLAGPVFGLVPNIDPDIPLQSAVDAGWYWQAAGLLALLVVVLLRWRASPLAAGLLWFLLALLPTNGLLPRLDLASDRHLYPALIGLAWAAALLLVRLPARCVLVAVLLLVLTMATLIRNEDYRSETALWLRTSQQSPRKARAWNNLGYACQQEGHPDCARAAWERALWLAPDDSKVRLNLYFLEKAR